MSAEEKQNNPYLDGRREWNERYGSYIAQAKNWRLFALFLLVISAISIAGVIYIGSQSKIRPYIVQVSEIGQPIASGEMKQLKYDEKVVKFGLADFITNLRTIYKADLNIQKKYVNTAYKYLNKGLPAYSQISEYYRANNPVSQEFDKQVEIISVLPLAQNQYQIDWIEKQFDKNGIMLNQSRYRATTNIMFKAPTTEPEVINNPIGLFIRDISFQKTLN